MSSYTYDVLKQMLQDWPQETSSLAGDYVPNIPLIIGMGEARLLKDLNLELFDYTNSGIFTQIGMRTVSKPSDLIQTRTMFIIDNAGIKHPLFRRAYSFCNRYAPDPAAISLPKYFCEFTDTQWLLVRTPDQNYTLEARYVRRPAGLSPSNQSTWFSINYGEVLFTTCLMETEHFIKADDRYADMQNKYYKEQLPIMRNELAESIRSGQYTPYLGAAKEAM